MPNEQPIARVCRDCAQPFVIDATELAWWRDLAARVDHVVTLPKRCSSCRFAWHRERDAVIDDGVDETLTCQDCGAGFRFGPADKRFFAARAWPRPKRCRICRTMRTTTGRDRSAADASARHDHTKGFR